MADVALAALAVLVREDDLTGRAVVYERLIPEYQTLLKHFQENPLRPLIEVSDQSCRSRGSSQRKIRRSLTARKNDGYSYP